MKGYIVEEEIKLYIQRSISDIARKCNTKTDSVIKVFKELYGKN